MFARTAKFANIQKKITALAHKIKLFVFLVVLKDLFVLFSDCRYAVFSSDHGHIPVGLRSSSASYPVS